MSRYYCCSTRWYKLVVMSVLVELMLTTCRLQYGREDTIRRHTRRHQRSQFMYAGACVCTYGCVCGGVYIYIYMSACRVLLVQGIYSMCVCLHDSLAIVITQACDVRVCMHVCICLSVYLQAPDAIPQFTSLSAYPGFAKLAVSYSYSTSARFYS